MIQEKSLSIPDLARELDLGIATTKFILKRFSSRFPFENKGGDPYYSRKTIPLLIQIKEGLDSGRLPSEIEQDLQDETLSDPMQDLDGSFQKIPPEHPAIGNENEGLSLIRSFFSEFKEVQQQMALSLNHIAKSLEEMNRNRAWNPGNRATPTGDEPALDMDEPDPLFLDPGEESEDDLDESFDMPDPPFDLLETSEIQMDDLSALIEAQPLPGQIQEELPEMDDLSALIEPKPEQLPTVDDSDPDDSDPDDLDDLGLLVEDDTHSLEIFLEFETPLDLDDLSALIDPAPSLKPDIDPEQDLPGYKAAIMKTILQLKTQGLTPGETTRQLNEQRIQTLSGKPLWSDKAILQIYKFINSAK